MCRLFYCLTALCIVLSCSPSGDSGGDGYSNAVTVRILDGNGNPVPESVRVDVFTVRTDFNSIVPYDDFDVSGGILKMSVYRPADLIVTAVAASYNPSRVMFTNVTPGQELEIVLEPRSGLRIMEYNVDYGWGYQDPAEDDWESISDARKKSFIGWVKAYDPDIITFCELNCFGFGTEERPGDIDADFQEFAQSYGHAYATLRKQGGRNSFPVGISSRYPLTDIEKVELNTAPQTGYRVHGFIQAECQGIRIIACHLSSQDAATREIEAAEIAGRLRESEYAIGSGDMNSDSREDLEHLASGVWPSGRWWDSPPEYAPVDMFLDAGLRDSYYIVSDSFQATCPAMDGEGNPYNFSTLEKTAMKVDCMMMSPALAERCDFAEIIQTVHTSSASDHFPYMVHLESID